MTWKFSLWKIPEGCIYEEGEFDSEESARKAAETEYINYLNDNPNENSDDYWVEVELDE
jgi:hypothetical protein